MAYLLCLLYVVIVYVRPGEIVPAWAGQPIAQIAGVVAAIVAAFSAVIRPRPVVNSPVDWCFIGFCLVSIVSNPANGWFGGGYLTLLDLLPLACFYFLIRVTVQTNRQLRGLIILLVALSLFQAVNGVVQYHTGTGFGGSTAIADRAQTADDADETAQIMRIRGTGIFNDPNDLAMSMLVVFPFLYTGILSPRPGAFRRLIGLAAIAVLGYALYLTQSRGAFVGFAALCAAYVYRRFGRKRGLVLGIVIFAAVIAIGSRRGEVIDSSEGSAQGRVQAWSAGIEMLKSNPLFGVGYGQFVEHHERVAHNSFVHTFAETGVVGAFFLVGMFFWFLVGSGTRRNVSGAARSTLARDLWASGIGVIACSWFLSRQYIPVLYLPLAMGATRITLEQEPESASPLLSEGDWTKVAVLTIALLLAVYVSVRTLALWS